MAYAYEKIDNLVSGQNSNIFGSGDQNNQDMPSQQTNMVKTSTAGDMQPLQSSSSSEVAPIKTQGTETARDRSRIFSQNVGKTETPKGVGAVSEQIKENQKRLQESANAYTQQYQQQYKAPEIDIKKAIGGNQEQFGRLSGLLSKEQADYRPEFEGGQGLGVSDKVSILGSQAGLQKLAAQGQGPRYTRGMGALDAMLMQRDPEFQKQIADIRRQNQEFEQQRADTEKQLESQAQAYGQSQLESAQDLAEQQIENYQKALQEQNTQEAQAYQENLKKLDREKIQEDAIAQARRQAEADLVQIYGSRAADQANFATIDPSQYFSYDPGNYGYQNFLDQSEADQFNRIAQLLGTGDTYQASSGLGPQYTVDNQALVNEILRQGQAERIRRDEAARAGINEILGTASGRASSFQALEDQRQLGLNEAYNNELNDLTNTILRENPELGQYYTEDMLQGYNPNIPQQAILGLGAQDVLSQDEATRLNRLSQELGLGDQYTAGTYTGPSDESLVPEQDFRNYLMEQLRGQQSAIAQGQAANQAESLNYSPIAGSLNFGTAPNQYAVLPSNERGVRPIDPRQFSTNSEDPFQILLA